MYVHLNQRASAKIACSLWISNNLSIPVMFCVMIWGHGSVMVAGAHGSLWMRMESWNSSTRTIPKIVRTATRWYACTTITKAERHSLTQIFEQNVVNPPNHLMHLTQVRHHHQHQVCTQLASVLHMPILPVLQCLLLRFQYSIHHL